ncbi:MAG TPA: hypothetical protein PK406_00565 [Verrucomicrobiota bacterium]|nr:hypothetical protein [Verrucomicrobiota bacterium]
MDLEAARATIKQEREARVEACSQEIAAALRKHNCELDVSVVLRAGQVIPQVQVVAK